MPAFRARGVVLGVLFLAACQAPGTPEPDSSRPALTFHKDIAPIILDHCATCHRPGQFAPFSLLTYADVAKRVQQIAAVTKSRRMPPWLPEPGYGEFVNVRRLRTDQLEIIEQWGRDGALEGNPSNSPSTPQWPEEWQLGEPDLVVDMPQPFTLPASGPDVFRNFVIPVPVASTRYVRGVEFRPGNPRIVHHATILIDRTRSSRRLDAEDPGPGYDGMLSEGASSPDGHFLGWTPGRAPTAEPVDMSWGLERGSDLVVQLHLMPTGKPETIRSSLGLFFTDTPPARVPFMVKLGSKTIDISAGTKAYSIQDTYVLPMDVDALSVYPHAHYLAKDMKGFATLPDGTVKWLIWIKDWNFSWQDQYRYGTPLFLPKGTVLTMQYTYDNSADNARNPHHPPRRVTYGPRSSDEMGDLWLQVLPRNSADVGILTADFVQRELHANVAAAEMMVQVIPNDAGRHNFLGTAYLQIGRVQEAMAHLEEALRLKPDYAEAHANLGSALRAQRRLPEAIRHFRMALRIKPQDDRVQFNLANALNEGGQPDDAIRHFRQALTINPDLAEAHNNLGVALGSRRRLDEAIGHFEQALAINPDYPDAHNNLSIALGAQGKFDDAIGHVRRALEIRPDYADAQNNLSLLLKSRDAAISKLAAER